jgi:hypothetical protein
MAQPALSARLATWGNLVRPRPVRAMGSSSNGNKNSGGNGYGLRLRNGISLVEPNGNGDDNGTENDKENGLKKRLQRQRNNMTFQLSFGHDILTFV